MITLSIIAHHSSYSRIDKPAPTAYRNRSTSTSFTAPSKDSAKCNSPSPKKKSSGSTSIPNRSKKETKPKILAKTYPSKKAAVSSSQKNPSTTLSTLSPNSNQITLSSIFATKISQTSNEPSSRPRKNYKSNSKTTHFHTQSPKRRAKSTKSHLTASGLQS